MNVEYRHIITMEPGKRSGKPTIRGLRTTVQDVLEYLASGMTAQEIVSDFPDLTEEDIPRLPCVRRRQRTTPHLPVSL